MSPPNSAIQGALERYDAVSSPDESMSPATTISNGDQWPALREEALYGLPGGVVRTIEPYTESDPVALLVNTLTAFGNCIGLTAHFKVEHTVHYPRLFVVFVGKSSVGRKGQSLSTLRYIFEQIDPEWSKERIADGLSSGEGLISEVRDERKEKRPQREGKKIVGYEEEVVDHGVSDKRLFIIEGEFSQVIKVMAREGSILSPIIRKAWDDGNLRTMTKNTPLRATGAHISIIGHISQDELLRYLNDTEQGNGFGNRFLWALVKRSKCLPNPIGTPLSSLNSLISQLSEAIGFTKGVRLMVRDDETEKVWASVYPALSDERPGLIGSLIARGPAQVMRLACLYALLDKSGIIQRPHLKAALALWDYCESSARIIFGDSLGDPYADRILSALREASSSGLTETDIWDMFGRHGGGRPMNALQLLKRAGLAVWTKGKSAGGRPPIIWRYCEKSEKSPPDGDDLPVQGEGRVPGEEG